MQNRKSVSRILLVVSLVSFGFLSCVSGPTAKERKMAEIEYDMGVNSLQAGNLKDALQNFKNSEKIYPEFPKVQNGLGLAYYFLRNFEKAIHHFDLALKYKPDYSEVLNSKARIYMDQGRFRQAIPLLRKALEDVFLPERFHAESNLGWCLFNTGQTEDGFRHVQNAIAQNEKYCVGYQYLGRMYQKQKKFTEAIRELTQLVELE